MKECLLSKPSFVKSGADFLTKNLLKEGTMHSYIENTMCSLGQNSLKILKTAKHLKLISLQQTLQSGNRILLYSLI